MVGKSLLLVGVWATQVLAQLPKRTISTSDIATPTSSKAAVVTTAGAKPTCCYLSSFEVGQILWYSDSINITVATVSTIVYKYDNTAVTSHRTEYDSTALIQTNFDDLPSTIIGTNLGIYEASTTLVRGTAFTDPYGVVYQSPTPVWVYTDVIYATATPTMKNSAYLCPSPDEIKNTTGNEISPYPSGFFLADNDPAFGWSNSGTISTTLPTELRDWMVSHAAANTASALPSLGQCALGAGRGIPTAYVPINDITATVRTTSTMVGDYGSISSLKSTAITVWVSSAASSVSWPKPTSSFEFQPSVTSFANTNVKTGPSSTTTQTVNVGTSIVTLKSKTKDTITSTIPLSITSLPHTTSLAKFSNGNETYTANSASEYIIGSSTLTPGGTITISSSTYILPTSATHILINGATQSISQTSFITSVSSRYLVIGSTTIIENTASAFVAGSQTLTKGGVMTAAGETLSLGPDGSIVLIMDWTSASSKSIGTTVTAVADNTRTTGANLPEKTSASDLRCKVDFWFMGGMVLLGMVGVLVL